LSLISIQSWNSSITEKKKRLTLGVQVLIGRHIVADNVVSSPSAEQREAWSQLQLGKVVLLAGRSQVRGRDVADLVAVVDIGSGWRQQSLDRLDRGRGALLAHVVESREGSLERGAIVVHVNGLLDGNVAPVRDLDETLQLAHDKERRVVLEVNGHLVLLEGLHVLVRSVGERRVALGCGLQLRVRLGLVRGQVNNGCLQFGRVQRVVVVVALEQDELSVGLADLGREGLQRVREHELDFECERLAGG
jgi:hypothetical protein